MNAQEFVKMVAALTRDGEVLDDGTEYDMPNDDAVDTLNRLILTAREIEG